MKFSKKIKLRLLFLFLVPFLFNHPNYGMCIPLSLKMVAIYAAETTFGTYLLKLIYDQVQILQQNLHNNGQPNKVTYTHVPAMPIPQYKQGSQSDHFGSEAKFIASYLFSHFQEKSQQVPAQIPVHVDEAHAFADAAQIKPVQLPARKQTEAIPTISDYLSNHCNVTVSINGKNHTIGNPHAKNTFKINVNTYEKTTPRNPYMAWELAEFTRVTAAEIEAINSEMQTIKKTLFRCFESRQEAFALLLKLETYAKDFTVSAKYSVIRRKLEQLRNDLRSILLIQEGDQKGKFNWAWSTTQEEQLAQAITKFSISFPATLQDNDVREAREIVEFYAQQGISGFERLQKAENKRWMLNRYYPENWQFKNRVTATDFFQNTFNKDLIEVLQLTRSGDYSQAYRIIQRYHQRYQSAFAQANQHHSDLTWQLKHDSRTMQEAYTKAFNASYNKFGIQHQYAHDPKCKKLGLKLTQVPNREANRILAARHAVVQKIIDTQTDPVIVGLAYDLLDHLNDPFILGTKLGQLLTTDSNNPSIIAAYKHYINANHLPRFAGFDSSRIAQLNLPSDFGTAKYTHLRTLLFQLCALPINSPTAGKIIQEGIQEIGLALSDKQNTLIHTHNAEIFFQQVAYSIRNSAVSLKTTQAITYDEYGVDNRFMYDPYYKQLQPKLEKTDTPNKKLNAILLDRWNISQVLFKKMGIQQPVPVMVQEIAYTTLDLLHDPLKLIEYLSQLSANHASPYIRTAYHYFFNEIGIPRFFDYDRSLLSDIVIPRTIGNQENVRARKVLMTLLKTEVKTPAQKANIIKGLGYVAKAVEPGEKQASEYLEIAENYTKSTIFPSFSKAIQQVTSFAHTFYNEHPKAVQASIVGCASIATAGLVINNLPIYKIYHYEQALNLLGQAEEKLLEGKTQEANAIVQQQVRPLIGIEETSNYCGIDYNDQQKLPSCGSGQKEEIEIPETECLPDLNTIPEVKRCEVGNQNEDEQLEHGPCVMPDQNTVEPETECNYSKGQGLPDIDYPDPVVVSGSPDPNDPEFDESQAQEDKTQEVKSTPAEEVEIELASLEEFSEYIEEEIEEILNEIGTYIELAHIEEFVGIKISIKELLEHIFDLEIIEKIHKSGKVKKQMRGFHHDWLSILEKSGLLKFVNVEINDKGIRKANIVINGDYFKTPKTFFPEDWNRKKVIEKIIESLQLLIKNPELQANGRWLIDGKTSEGIIIRTIIDPINRIIITSFPLNES